MADTAYNDPTYRAAARELERWLKEKKARRIAVRTSHDTPTPTKEHENV